MQRSFYLAFALLMGFISVGVHAVDSDGPSSPSSWTGDKLTSARRLIEQNKFNEAVIELRRKPERRDADWNNLMGFSLRKSSPPDLEAAENFYKEALRIDPKHRGALEYSGELYLMKGDLARAEAQLASLAKVCSDCEPYADLKASIQRFKASGTAVKTTAP